jgi:hypothetical protein
MDKTPAAFQPLPGRTVNRSAEYEALLRDLLSLVNAEPPEVREQDSPSSWRHRARRAAGATIANRAGQADETGPVPDEWFEPLIRAMVHEPDPSFVEHLVKPAITAFGRRRVRLALLDYLETGTSADAAGAARAWYWTLLPLTYLAGSREPNPDSVAEREKYRDLDRRYNEVALRRFVTDTDLDVRRCLIPGLHLRPEDHRRPHMRELAERAAEIARSSDDEYIRHRASLKGI